MLAFKFQRVHFKGLFRLLIKMVYVGHFLSTAKHLFKKITAYV